MLGQVLEELTYLPGDFILNPAEPSCAMYFVTAGIVEVLEPLSPLARTSGRNQCRAVTLERDLDRY